MPQIEAMDEKKENKIINRNGFMKVFGLGFVASVINNKSLSGLIDNKGLKANESNDIDEINLIEPKPNNLSVSRRKNNNPER